MNNEPKGIGGCILGTLEMIGFLLALIWPLLLLLLPKCNP